MENTQNKLTPAEMQNWLGIYTNDIIMKVMEHFDEIQNNEFAVKMIKELYIREHQEQKDEIISMASLMNNFKEWSKFNIHNHSLEHSKSYRDVLYDMFIKVI